MSLPVLLSLFVGVCVVVQGGLNRVVGNSYGVAGATVINSVVVLLCSLMAYVLVNEVKVVAWPQEFSLPAGTKTFKTLKWWYLASGLFGFFIVFGIPYGIAKIGALKTTVLVLCAQVLASLLWDCYMEKMPLSWLRAAGGGLTLLGAVMATFR